MKAAKKKAFSTDIKSKYKGKFPQVLKAKCSCERHKADCGCLSESFIKGACINHFCCLQQCKDPNEYVQRLRNLSQYHVHDIHEWEDGACDFCPLSNVPVRNVMVMQNQNGKVHHIRQSTN